MENEKKAYKTPKVTKVEFDAGDRITASGCLISNPNVMGQTLTDMGSSLCFK